MTTSSCRGLIRVVHAPWRTSGGGTWARCISSAARAPERLGAVRHHDLVATLELLVGVEHLDHLGADAVAFVLRGARDVAHREHSVHERLRCDVVQVVGDPMVQGAEQGGALERLAPEAIAVPRPLTREAVEDSRPGL